MSSKMADSQTLSLFPEETDTVEIICGADEAGRGPIAGPVYAAAVVLDPDNPVEGLKDSKKLSEKQRDALAPEIKQKAKAWAIASCTTEEIDQLNILWASMLAMKRAIEALAVKPTIALIDGNRIPKGLAMPAEAIVKGDDKVPEISAASILAKTARDAVMMELHAQYPEYGFDRHKGYPTAYHLQQLEKHGVSPVHRRSYAPVRRLLEKQTLKED
ncbi:MAG: ribonuclease HII [Oxalobacter sp.]|nr:ribonuclease HII [Oxalobacter sp.]